MTGAGSGIGYVAAQLLVEEGAAVALLARDETAVKDAAVRLGDDTLAVPADVRDSESVAAAAGKAHAWHGRLDIVVTCAGPQIASAPLADTDHGVLGAALDTKLRRFVRVARAVLPKMTGGAIVDVAGATVHLLVPGAAVTGITNAAVVALTSYLAAEAAQRGVRVNAVSPGMTLTEGRLARHEAMAEERGLTADAVRTDMVDAPGIHLSRWARTEEIASAVAFLASADASYLTGQVLRVDGGLTKQVA
ncbi:SDR family NAD(P)-dependent oxidoreductase [Amycolatopsis sp. FDAARGOS 1241]|uniref:SDR family NAD(P)-dependent oxidoreductase n=1 Tax=Amycolatopsis sp. FDAARGOS 1241 TaxID=2778070 RepID=UPI001EF25992|nr:SDR family oxidoreductase [Amycolatopsis sp. FDAARGOS 1241]